MQTDAISRSAVHIAINSRVFDTEYPSEFDELERLIDEIPALDVVPVVHARWIDPCINKYGHPCHHCSACRFKASKKDRNFCPNCGARMDGEKRDAT